MRHFAKYLFTMVIVVLILGLLDLGILVGVTLVTHGDTFFVSVKQVSMSIKNKDGTYVLDQARQEELDELNAFLLIIGEEGSLIGRIINLMMCQKRLAYQMWRAFQDGI